MSIVGDVFLLPNFRVVAAKFRHDKRFDFIVRVLQKADIFLLDGTQPWLYTRVERRDKYL